MKKRMDDMKSRLEKLGFGKCTLKTKLSSQSGSDVLVVEGRHANDEGALRIGELLGLEGSIVRLVDEAVKEARFACAVYQNRLVLDGYLDSQPKIYGFDESKVTRDEALGRLYLEPAALDEDSDVIILSDGGETIVVRREAELVEIYEQEDIESGEAHRSSRAVMEFLATTEDAWLRELTERWARVGTPINRAWSLSAYLRYRGVKPDDGRHLDARRGPPDVEQAESLLELEVEGHKGTLVQFLQDELMNLYDEIIERCNAAADEEVFEEDDWLQLCRWREQLTVFREALPNEDNRTKVDLLMDRVDEVGELLIVESGASHFDVRDEMLWRGLLAGDRGWWLSTSS